MAKLGLMTEPAPAKKTSVVKIYDAERGKTFNLDALIRKLGTQAVAKRYGVTESTVKKWSRALHKPSRRTLIRPMKPLF